MVSLPTRKSLTVAWNFGSILGMVLVFQILTGFLLVFYYISSGFAFDSVQYIIYESNFGFLFRIFHINGASLFFIFLYLHFFKGLFFGSYRLKGVWLTGLVIFLIIMMISFIGYVLVWAQMSFWAAVVITSLLSVIPFIGNSLVLWIWGGFSVGGATLKFLFVLHFLLPWLLFVLVVVHLLFLHKTGRTSKLYCHGDYDKVCFRPFYYFKDAYNIVFFFFFVSFSLFSPYFFRDPEIFIAADPITSPVHIVPEWYFLFAYAILRAIPNKILGVIALLLSILVFFFFVFFNNYTTLLSNLNKFVVFTFLFVGIILSWLGQCHVESPFSDLSVIFSCLYFFIIVFIIFYNFLSSLLFK